MDMYSTLVLMAIILPVDDLLLVGPTRCPWRLRESATLIGASSPDVGSDCPQGTGHRTRSRHTWPGLTTKMQNGWPAGSA